MMIVFSYLISCQSSRVHFCCCCRCCKSCICTVLPLFAGPWELFRKKNPQREQSNIQHRSTSKSISSIWHNDLSDSDVRFYLNVNGTFCVCPVQPHTHIHITYSMSTVHQIPLQLHQMPSTRWYRDAREILYQIVDFLELMSTMLRIYAMERDYV